MNLDYLTRLLAAGTADDVRRSLACPDEHQIAGYVDGGLDEAARTQVELHLADCQYCLALVGLLSRERHADAIEPTYDEAVAQTRTRATKRPQRWWQIAPQWAAAAALVLAVPLLLQFGRDLDRSDEGQGRPDPIATRNPTSAAEELQLLSPGAGTAMDARQLAFRWTEIPGTPYYDVRIVTDAGDVVIRERVTGTTWRPPAQTQLRPGADYFVHIDAYPSGDKTVSSDHVPFRISE